MRLADNRGAALSFIYPASVHGQNLAHLLSQTASAGHLRGMRENGKAEANGTSHCPAPVDVCLTLVTDCIRG